MEKSDVIIIGAGPAGASCASVVAKAGYKVSLVEKKSSIGEPVQCGEYIPKLFLNSLKIKKEFISNEITSMKTYIEFSEYENTNSPGYLIMRDKFDRALCLDAIHKGAKLFIDTKVEKIENNTIIANTKMGNVKLQADIIVGADGPLSKVGRNIGSINRSFVNTFQVELPRKGEIHSTKVYFFKECPCGYGWVFPKKETFNIGVGIPISFKKNPLEILDCFLEKLNLRKKRAIRYTKGLIPIGGILDTIVKDNFLLIGDAAGFVHAITGAGIPQAVKSGEIAGKYIVKSLRNDDISILQGYDSEVIEQWGEYLGTSVRKRKYMEKNWFKENLHNIVRNSWVAFKDYYNNGKKK